MILCAKVYGTAVAVSARDPTRFQHQGRHHVVLVVSSNSLYFSHIIFAKLLHVMQGFGILLMEEAERIAREEHGSEKLLVISGVGTRHYYRKMGYQLDGPYMSKMLL